MSSQKLKAFPFCYFPFSEAENTYKDKLHANINNENAFDEVVIVDWHSFDSATWIQSMIGNREDCSVGNQELLHISQ
ncbi:hypothetical protein WN943_022572 [Citrus x changshan-huyou]